MTDILAWLASLPEPLLYAALVVAAFAENVFPPLPADSVIALGAFVAAQGSGSATGVFLATMFGNIGGAMLMYALGHRFGLPWLTHRFPSLCQVGAAERMGERFASQGLYAVMVSRFLPGVRALVPPLAGAMGLGAGRALLAMSVASAVWYGLVCLVAFRAGANAEALLERLAAQQRAVGFLAAAVVLAAAGAMWWRRRRAP